MYDTAFIINVNKCPKPFFLEQHIDIVFKAFGRSEASSIMRALSGARFTGVRLYTL